MPCYTYKCEFGHVLEEYQSIKAFDKNRVVICSECSNVMETVIGEPLLVTVDNGPTTIGQLGERNFKKLGKVKGDEMLAKNKENKELADREYLKSKGVDGVTLPEYKKMRKLANLTKEQQNRYIDTGKLTPGK